MTSVEKQNILMYEKIFKNEIKNCIIQMQEYPLDIRFSTMQFSAFINQKNYWIIYKIAKYMHKCVSRGKRYHYGKSSSWHPQTIQIKMNRLYLMFGKRFPTKSIGIMLMPIKNEIVKINENKLIRVDIIHNDMFWYANFLIEIQEND